MTAPKRIQMSRQHPWRVDHPNAVIVARGHDWGNPYRVGEGIMWAGYGLPPFSPLSITRELAVALYRAWLLEFFGPGVHDQIARELGGRDLACWCPLDLPCHADVLLEIANAGRVLRPVKGGTRG